jgi:DNA invertase Pin-like site-specific DNA recombinase
LNSVIPASSSKFMNGFMSCAKGASSTVYSSSPFAALYEFERETTLQRQKEGISAAKSRGVRFGRPVKSPPANFVEVVREWEQGKIMTKTALELTGLSESTFYRRHREFKSGKKK